MQSEFCRSKSVPSRSFLDACILKSIYLLQHSKLDTTVLSIPRPNIDYVDGIKEYAGGNEIAFKVRCLSSTIHQFTVSFGEY